MANIEEAQRLLKEATMAGIREHKVLFTIQAVLMIIGGIVAIIYPMLTSAAIVLMLGWLLIFTGIVQGISLFSKHRGSHFWLQLVSAVLSIWVGILLVRNPGEGMMVITILLAVYLLVEGVAKIAFSLSIRPYPNWGWVLVSGLIGVALGIYLFAQMPTVALWLIGVLVGVHLLAEGIALGMLIFKSRD
jgi:uncharacterized membrane protein HdeD (DUF308 family)